MLLTLFACFAPVDKYPETGFDSDPPTSDSDPVDDTAPPDDTATDNDGDGFPPGDDCDDDDAAVFPGAEETCDGVDQDCDGENDEDLTLLQYPDSDDDGYGRNGDESQQCPGADGFSTETGDCDDTDPDIHPGATDERNGIDDDCDGEFDEDAGPVMIEVTTNWTSAGLTMTITGAPPSYDFGMAETGAGAVGWYGETCIPGAEPGGMEDYGYDVCHVMDATGGSLPTVALADLDDAGTLFTKTIADRGDITYLLADTATLDCWVWGDDPSYYADYACTEL